MRAYAVLHKRVDPLGLPDNLCNVVVALACTSLSAFYGFSNIPL